MQVRVRLFGSIREATGAKELVLTLPTGATLAHARARLAADHPAFAQSPDRLRAAVNEELAPESTVLAEGDEVAFLPPVAGGQDPSGPGGPDPTHGQGPPGGQGLSGVQDPVGGAAGRRCTLSSEPLDVGEVVGRVMGPDAGGLVTFVGAVRDASRGRSIRSLEYEAYPAMAEREMERIADEAERRWGGVRVAIAHRVGYLEIGALAVVIAAAAPHRAEAFAAARYTIDTLKERVPIWKKEVATDGEYWVEEHA